MHCKFSKNLEESDLEVKIGDVTPYVSKFKYLGLILQNDGEINDVMVVKMVKGARDYLWSEIQVQREVLLHWDLTN